MWKGGMWIGPGVKQSRETLIRTLPEMSIDLVVSVSWVLANTKLL